MTTTTTRAASALRQRLDLLASQAVLIDQLQAEAADLRERLAWAESWRQEAVDAFEEAATASGGRIGLSLSGRLKAVSGQCTTNRAIARFPH